MIFVDTSAWFALYVSKDPNSVAARGWLAANPQQLFTTDYVVDEALTLFRSRGQSEIALDFGSDSFGGRLGTIHYLTPVEIAEAWKVFERYADKDWSFTDCTSKVIIEKLGIPTAFTFDHHFRQFGSVTVVP